MPEPRELVEADLAEYVEGESWPAAAIEAEDGTPVEPVPLENQEAAQGVLRRLKRLGREADQINEVADFEVARVEAWRQDRLGIIDRDLSWGRRALEIFWRGAAPARKVRSLALADGKLALVKHQAKVVFTDQAAFLAWAVEVEERGTGKAPDDPSTREITVHHPELVRVTVEPAKDAIKKLTQGKEHPPADGVVATPLSLPDGELVPGVELQRPADDRFDLKLGED